MVNYFQMKEMIVETIQIDPTTILYLKIATKFIQKNYVSYLITIFRVMRKKLYRISQLIQ